MQTDGPGKTPFPAAYQFADTFQPSEQPIWKAIYFQTYQVGVLAAGAEWIITSIKIHSARGQWIFCVTTYPVLSSLNVCRFFSYAYIQSVSSGQLWEAQESSPEVWFLLPCCLVVVVLGCGAGGVMGGQQPQGMCCPPWVRTQREALLVLGLECRLTDTRDIIYEHWARRWAVLCYYYAITA